MKRCHSPPPEGDTFSNAITWKCKLGMLTYITKDVSVCPPEWYQSANFRVLAHALIVIAYFLYFSLSCHLYADARGRRNLYPVATLEDFKGKNTAFRRNWLLRKGHKKLCGEFTKNSQFHNPDNHFCLTKLRFLLNPNS